MNFYKRYPGDYGRDTAHLSLLEHGAYTVMLDTYYSTGQPLPKDMATLCRICRAVSKTERAAVASVADQFFPVGADGLRHNRRADSEIGKHGSQADTNRRIAVERERKRNEHESINESLRRNEHETSTNRSTNDQPSQKPEARSQKEASISASNEHPTASLTEALRAAGVRGALGTNPHVIRWREQGVTAAQVIEAARIAIQDRGKANPPLAYLAPIVEELRGGPLSAAAQPSKTAQAIAVLESMKGPQP